MSFWLQSVRFFQAVVVAVTISDSIRPKLHLVPVALSVVAAAAPDQPRRACFVTIQSEAK
jgi:hypothetical protein